MSGHNRKKKDGQRKPWDRDKILAGLQRACYKRPVDASELVRIRDEVEDEVFNRYDREVPSSAIGEMVTDRLRRVDQVAYVRFASVYRQFKTLDDLVDEAEAVLDARRYEDPTQGRLFIEAQRAGAPSGGAAPARRVNGEKPRGTRGRKPRVTENGHAGAKETEGREGAG